MANFDFDTIVIGSGFGGAVSACRLAEKKHKVLVWTGPKTALTELIYALFSNGTINHGAADINTLTASFEDFFNIKLDNIYKTYTEIKARKSSKTKFLEELTLNLQQKMYREDQE